MTDIFDSISGGAHFSACRKYRYYLWRVWDIQKPIILFIGLNPSTANENMDDNTIRRVKRFAHKWGYGGVYMMNLFAWVTKEPKELLLAKDPVGDNDKSQMPNGTLRVGIFSRGADPGKKCARDVSQGDGVNYKQGRKSQTSAVCFQGYETS